MATKLYLRDLAWTGANNPPKFVKSLSSAGASFDQDAPGALTPRQLSLTKGTAHVGITQNTLATTSQQTIFFGTFVSPPLAASVLFDYDIFNIAQFSVGNAESSTNANFSVAWLDVICFRPSTGAIVGVLGPASAYNSVPQEPTATDTVQSVYITGQDKGPPTADFTGEPGDVIVVQVSARFTQSMGSAYTGSFYFDGSTEATGGNQANSNIAAWINLPWNFTFAGPSAPIGTASGVAVSSIPSAILGSLSSAEFAPSVAQAASSIVSAALTVLPLPFAAAAKATAGVFGNAVYAELVQDASWFDNSTILPSGRRLRQFAGDTGPNYSDDGGATWKQAATHASANVFVSDSAGVNVVQSSAAYRSANGGLTWSATSGVNGYAETGLVFGASKFVHLRSLQIPSTLSSGYAPRFCSSADGAAWVEGSVLSDSVVPSTYDAFVVKGNAGSWFEL